MTSPDTSPDSSPRSDPVGTGLAVVTEVVTMVVVEPIRQGRLRTTQWPPGLAAVVGLALTGMVVAAGVVLSAPLQRRHVGVGVYLSGDLIFPRWSVALFLVLIALTLSLLHTACLHLAWWLRVGSLFVVALMLHGLVLQPPDVSLAPNVVVWVACAVLAVLTVVRWRAAFAWWEFATAFLAVGGAIGLALRISGDELADFGFDNGPGAMALGLSLVAGLSVPFTFVAGLAFAQLATLLTHRVADVVDAHAGPTRVVGALAALVGLGALALTARHLTGPTDSGFSHLRELLAAAVLLALALGAGVLVALRHVPTRSRALDVLEDAVTGAALPAGLLITATVVPAQLCVLTGTQITRLGLPGGEDVAAVGEWLYRSDVLTWSRVAAAVLLVGWAVWLRRRRPLPALLAGVMGVTLLVASLGAASGDRLLLPWTSEAVTDVATLASAAAFVVLALARRLTRRRALALGVALGLSLAYSVRAAFDAPFVALFGLGATAAVFLGVVWASLTGAADANTGSERWPQPARVLLFLGNSLLAMITLAFLSVASAYEIGLDTGLFAGLGDDYLGTALLLSAYAVLAREVATVGHPR